MVYDPKSKSCVCPKVTKPKCEDLKIYCEFGDHKMVWDEKEGVCKCPPA